MTLLRTITTGAALVFTLVTTANVAQAAIQKAEVNESISNAKARCTAPASDEPYLYSNDFKWYYSMKEMKEKFEQTYSSGKRLYKRAFYDHKNHKFVVPRSSDPDSKMVALTERFLKSVTRHIETALQQDYADFIFFPDMGHSHLYIPLDYYENVLQPLPLSESHNMYTKALAYPGLKVLYHTAEQLKQLQEDKSLVKDRYVMWRYFTRNPVGDNKENGIVELVKQLERSGNAAGERGGYYYWGAGYSISANADGCFSYTHEGKKYYYDISLQDLPYQSSGNDLADVPYGGRRSPAHK